MTFLVGVASCGTRSSCKWTSALSDDLAITKKWGWLPAPKFYIMLFYNLLLSTLNNN